MCKIGRISENCRNKSQKIIRRIIDDSSSHMSKQTSDLVLSEGRNGNDSFISKEETHIKDEYSLKNQEKVKNYLKDVISNSNKESARDKQKVCV